MPYLTKEKKASFFADFGTKPADTGSTQGQIALLTERSTGSPNTCKPTKKIFLPTVASCNWSARESAY